MMNASFAPLLISTEPEEMGLIFLGVFSLERSKRVATQSILYEMDS